MLASWKFIGISEVKNFQEFEGGSPFLFFVDFIDGFSMRFFLDTPGWFFDRRFAYPIDNFDQTELFQLFQ